MVLDKCSNYLTSNPTKQPNYISVYHCASKFNFDIIFSHPRWFQVHPRVYFLLEYLILFHLPMLNRFSSLELKSAKKIFSLMVRGKWREDILVLGKPRKAKKGKCSFFNLYPLNICHNTFLIPFPRYCQLFDYPPQGGESHNNIYPWVHKLLIYLTRTDSGWGGTSDCT